MIMFGQHDFRQYHGDTDTSTHLYKFNVDLLDILQKHAVARCLRYREICNACRRVEAKGILELRLQRLSKARYCHGCEETYLQALFFPEDLMKDARYLSTLYCIGRSVNMSVCYHDSAPVVAWGQTPEPQSDRQREHGQGTPSPRLWDACHCPDQDHQLKGKQPRSQENFRSLSPRLVREYQVNERGRATHIQYIRYSWDVPLVTVCNKSRRLWKPSLAAISKALQMQLSAGLANHKLCRHVSAADGAQLWDFARAGICKCFQTGGHAASDCACRSQKRLECRICGATYAWRFLPSRIYLSYRFCCNVEKPTSLGWLGLLDASDLGRLFTNDTKHVLWCDEPACATEKLYLWEGMIKENAARANTHRRGEPNDSHSAVQP
jgi:hypothetical protein